jgi:ubiquitin C-terminal hydrolase
MTFIVPRVLIVHLKRFTYLGTKLKTPLNFPEFFSFDSDYILDEQAIKEQNHAYKLSSVIVHQGYSAHKGHYYCYIRPPNTDIWYKYDDESVKQIDSFET